MHAMRVYEYTPVARPACTGAHSPRKSWISPRPMASCALASLPTQVSKRQQYHCFARECLFPLRSSPELGFDSEAFGTLLRDPSSVLGKHVYIYGVHTAL